jgi:hypothetical protein
VLGILTGHPLEELPDPGIAPRPCRAQLAPAAGGRAGGTGRPMSRSGTIPAGPFGNGKGVGYRGRVKAPLALVVVASLGVACASAPPPLPAPTWIPPPQSAACTDASPCENVKRWFAVEKEAAEAWPACHPVPVRGSELACARADAAYARVHREQIEYFGGLCGGSVGSSYFAVAPFLGTPENDRMATCGGKGGSGPFPCRVLEWTWATASKGGAFVMFLVQPGESAPGVWAVNSCSYCESGGTCRDLPFRP